MTDKTINWRADEWFAEYHADDATDAFKAWWITFYGKPSDFYDCESEQEEYWTRCGFAWLGWKWCDSREVTP